MQGDNKEAVLLSLPNIISMSQLLLLQLLNTTNHSKTKQHHIIISTQRILPQILNLIFSALNSVKKKLQPLLLGKHHNSQAGKTN